MNLNEVQSKLAASLILGNALSSINNIDFKITNNNYYAALPDCLAILLKQASDNYQQLEKTMIKKILGKRNRKYKKRQSKGFLESYKGGKSSGDEGHPISQDLSADSYHCDVSRSQKGKDHLYTSKESNT
jgi:hypothetical protein